MRSTIPLKVCLGTGMTSYCLVVLASQDAPVPILAIMGTMALSLCVISMALLWLGGTNSENNEGKLKTVNANESEP